MKTIFAIPIFAALFTCSAFGKASTSSSQKFDSCIESAAGVTYDNINCITAEIERQDNRLNTAYKKLLAKLTNGQQSQLKAAQRAWIVFRDKNSAYYYDPEGGTDAHMASVFKYLEMTTDRASELELQILQQDL